MEKKLDSNKTLRTAMVSGAVWMVGMRWAIRGIGLISTVILARLLTPEDFGLVAMSMLFVAFLDIMTSFGADLALIQRQDTTEKHYDVAWTLRLIQCLFVALCIILISPLAEVYFDEPRVIDLMLVLSLSVAISGFENIGTVAFRKDLEFSKEFRLNVVAKLASFFITIGLALLWRNYWALAWGTVSARLITVIFSYLLHPYRPRFSLVDWRGIWSFSQWMLLRNIGMYVRRKFDAFMVGGLFPASFMGIFTVSKEVAEMPTTEVVWPMARALFPGYAKIGNQPERLGRAYTKVLNTTAFITIPLGLGLALVSEPLVLLLLGGKWTGAIPVLPWLVLYSIVLTLSMSVQHVLMAIGRMKRLVKLVWFQTLINTPVVIIAGLYGDITNIAQAQFVITTLSLPIFFYALISISITSWQAIIFAIARPLIAGLVMSVFVLLASDLAHSLIMDLITRVSIGAVSFILVSYLLWHITGRPDGGEYLIIELLAKKVSRLKAILDTE